MENNEPVAWINDENIVAVGECPKDFIHSWKPLYTHPAKTLTDEEIYKIAMEVQTGFFPQDDTLEFAKAILKKAQEQ